MNLPMNLSTRIFASVAEEIVRQVDKGTGIYPADATEILTVLLNILTETEGVYPDQLLAGEHADKPYVKDAFDLCDIRP